MVTLYKNFKYNNKYDYIKTFSSILEQENYFNALEKIYYDEQDDYIREGEPFLIEYSHQELVENNVNYIKYNNGYRNIYAFITEKRYINDEITEIVHQIDVIQTFMFDFDIKNSFIERKACEINEITDFDEGLDLGEHIIESETVVFDKESQYFAMFNGFKKQKLIFDKDNVLKGIELFPCATQKPLTIIDYIQYPCYFMPLASTYPEPLTLADDSYYEKGTIGGGGGQDGDNDGYYDGHVISKKIYRFLKGYEAFASTSYLDSGGVETIGYGTTPSSGYWNSLFPSCTEEQASLVLAESIYNNYASSLLNAFENDGIDVNAIKTRHFDAFLSLCYNGGLGAVTTSPMYSKFIKNMNDTSVTDGWDSWYITDGNNELEGLKLRRQAEMNIFNNGVYEYRSIGLVGNDGSIVGTLTDNNGHGHIPDNLGGDI